MEILRQRNIAPAASRILRPGIRSLAPNVERHMVPGGGSVVVELKAGDAITLTDLEGGQPCEVCFADTKGTFDMAGLGVRADGKAMGLKAMLDSPREDARRTVSALRRRNFRVGRAAEDFG